MLRLRPRHAVAPLAVIALGGTLLVAFFLVRPLRPTPLAPLPGDWAAVVRLAAGSAERGAVDGAAFDARFSDPFGVAVTEDGAIHVADAGDAQRIRRLTSDGAVTTLAGAQRGFHDGTGAAAAFDTPSGLAAGPGQVLYVADTGNNAIRRVTGEGIVTTVAGDGSAGFRDGPARTARFNGPVGVTVDRAGRIIVADTYNDRIRVITPEGDVVTIAGSGDTGALDGAALEATFDSPCGVVVDDSGRIYVADTGNGLIRVISGTDGDANVSTLPIDLFRPIALTVGDGQFFATDSRGRIVAFRPDGAARVLAGSQPGYADGRGDVARFRRPSGLAWVGEGRLVVADSGNAVVRHVAAPSRLGVLPPGPPSFAPRFDADAFALLPLLWPAEPMAGWHDVAGTLGEARGDMNGTGRDRFHAGLDIREPQGTLVVSVRDSTVEVPVATSGFGSLSESISIGPLTYVHLRVGRNRQDRTLDASRFLATSDARGRTIRIRVKRGTRFRTGDVIGTTNRFNHVHLNVGWPGEEENPLRFRLPMLTDTTPPTIAPGGIRLFDEEGRPLARRVKGRVAVSGRVHVTVDAWDRIDGNPPQRRLGVYRAGYQVLDADGRPASGFERVRETMEFSRLGPDVTAPLVVFAPGSGIPFYGAKRTRFLYQVTNRFRNGVAEAGVLDLSTLAPGPYVLRVLIADAAGNEAIKNRDLPLLVGG